MIDEKPSTNTDKLAPVPFQFRDYIRFGVTNGLMHHVYQDPLMPLDYLVIINNVEVPSHSISPVPPPGCLGID